MPKAIKKATPRRRTPATPASYSFTAAVNEALAAHPDAAIFAAVAEYNTAWPEASKFHKQARAADFAYVPRGSHEAARRALAAEKRLLSLVPTTPEGAAALLRAVYDTMEELPTSYKLMGAAVKHAVELGL